jgi:hypothetical protein
MKKQSPEIKIEGYWKEGRWDKEKQKWIGRKSSIYPRPKSSNRKWKKLTFLKSLHFLEGISQFKIAKGWSNCRLCGKKNGSSEFQYKNWKWPSGLFHYVNEHNVIPSKEFIDFVLTETKRKKHE